jgi:hypothetical protein
MTYLQPVCKCGSKMVTHVRTEKEWTFSCSVCRSGIERSAVVAAELKTFENIGK